FALFGTGVPSIFPSPKRLPGGLMGDSEDLQECAEALIRFTSELELPDQLLGLLSTVLRQASPGIGRFSAFDRLVELVEGVGQPPRLLQGVGEPVHLVLQ